MDVPPTYYKRNGRDEPNALSRGRYRLNLEHETGFEPATLTLAIYTALSQRRRFVREFRRHCPFPSEVNRCPAFVGPRLNTPGAASAGQVPGAKVAYVSKQLGHADVHVTARHYARSAGGDEYREPMALEVSEVPADLLARLGDGRSLLSESRGGESARRCRAGR